MEGYAPALEIETAELPQVQSMGKDPMETRWGINCAVRDKFIEGSKTGFAILPFAKWFKIAHFTTPEEIHSTDDDPNFAREKLVTKTALSAERYLDAILGGKTLYGQRDPQKDDWGIRFSFHGEEDLAKMEVISATLLPSLPEIRQLAKSYGVPSPIGDRCDGEDTADFGERQSCPTCWQNWITSECCSRFMRDVASNGRNVTVTDIISRKQTSKTITPTTEELEDSRLLMIESLQRGILANQKIWTLIANELESKERRGIDTYQNNIRKDVHAAKPQDAQLRNIQEFARATSAYQAPVPVTDDLTDEERLMIYQLRVNAKREAQGDIPIPSAEFMEGQDVLCEGALGTITEAKSGGWYLVVMEDGSPSKTVRKDKLQVR